MDRRSIIGMSVTTVLGLAWLPSGAVSQQKSMKEQLLGTWSLVSFELVRPDGSRASTYGANPKGIAFFDAGGHYIITVMRAQTVPNTRLIAPRRVQPRKTKQPRKGRSPTLGPTLQTRRIAPLPFTLTVVRSRIGTGPTRSAFLQSRETTSS
jgi:hypothetical protein